MQRTTSSLRGPLIASVAALALALAGCDSETPTTPRDTGALTDTNALELQRQDAPSPDATVDADAPSDASLDTTAPLDGSPAEVSTGDALAADASEVSHEDATDLDRGPLDAPVDVSPSDLGEDVRPDTGALADSGGAADTGADGGDAASGDAGVAPAPLPGVVPVIDAAMKARLRAVLAAGLARGNRADVFAKVGDSITESNAFLGELGCERMELDRYESLRPLIQYYRRTRFPADYTDGCDEANSFNVRSLAAVSGWTAEDALLPLEAPPSLCTGADRAALRCELTRLRPAVALVMYGTNDLSVYHDAERFRVALQRVVDTLLEFGVIPVLSTIPPRLDFEDLRARVAPHNTVITEVARARQVPLWDFHRALTTAPGMVNQGLDTDGVHPNLYGGCEPPIGCAPADFTREGLRYGFNLRNLTALQVLEHVRAVVLEDGRPD